MNNPKNTVDISFLSIIRLLTVCLVAYFLFYVKDILFTVFVSVLLAMIMEPTVNKLEKEKNIPRVFGTGALFLIAGIAISIIIYMVAPPLAKEISQLAINAPKYLSAVDFNYIIENGNNAGFSTSDFQSALFDVSNSLKNATLFFFNGVMGIVGGILSMVLIFVMSFYLILEKNGVEKFIKAIAPRSMQMQSLRIVQRVKKKLGHWFIGQISLGFIVGLLSFLGLYLIGVPYALVLAVLAGLLELIPYIGPILSAIPAIIIAFTVSPTTAIFTFILYFFIQQFENYLIVPKVMEKSVGLHPIIIIIAALIGGKLAGIAGMILAVPIATIISIIWDDVKQTKDSSNI